MKLSAPIYHLKRKAKRLSREEGISLHDALDRVATTEGFSVWSMLAAKAAAATPANRLFPQFQPGDLVLVGARPGQGKTLMSLELAVEAMKSGHRAAFFSLEYTEKDVLDRIGRGDKVSPTEYYMRATPYYETASEKYGWLNRIVSVAYGHRMAGGAIYQVFEVL